MPKPSEDWTARTKPGGKALRPATNNSPSGQAQWVLRCDCGREFTVTTSLVRRRKSFQCRPCSNGEGKARKHGESKTKLYAAWDNMKRRCHDPKATGYHRYGGRGIFVCDEWRGDFAAFKTYLDDHLGTKPTPQHTLDRIDPDDGYKPGNVRWATRQQQAANKSKIA